MKLTECVRNILFVLPKQLLIVILIISFQNSFSQNYRAATGEKVEFDCSNWLKLSSQPSFVKVGDLDITGNKITVEAVFNRTSPWSGVDLYQGDLVSKHRDPIDCNYLLRPSSAEITTTNGYYKTPVICPIELNKTYHAAMVYDGVTLKFYRNGYLMSQVQASGDLVLNNWQTKIGLYDEGITQENFIGYVNEVRIWNIAKTQKEINENMFQNLPFPQSMSGLLAYYTFDNLTNKQGNSQWNGILGGNASINETNTTCSFIIDSCGTIPACKSFKPDFSFTREPCSPKSVSLKAYQNNITQYKWEFSDGKMSAAENPTIAFEDFGLYQVKLITETEPNCKDSVIKTIPVFLTKSDLILNADTTICRGDIVQLTSKTTSLNFCWQPTVGLSDASLINPVASPIQKTTYYLTSQNQSNNLVVNGDFSQGNMGFASSYSASSSGLPAGVYTVSSNIVAWHPSMSPCNDRTSGNGNMMLVNGADKQGVNVWSQTVAVSPNTNYAFSTWVQTITTINPAKLQFSINDVQLGDILNANSSSCKWDNFYTIWNSGDNTSARISIVNMNQEFSGNDFAIDDISFTKIEMLYDSITIDVSNPVQVAAIPDTTICQQTTIELAAKGAAHYLWQPSTGLSNPNISNPTASPASTTTYIVSAYNEPGCVKKDTVVVTVVAKPAFSISPLKTKGCIGDEFIATASGSDSYHWFTKTRSMISSHPSISQTLNGNDTFFVAVNSNTCNIQDTLMSIVQASQKPLVSLSKSGDIDCEHLSTQIIATGGNVYQWTNKDFINNNYVNNPIVNPEKDTWYKVVVSNDTVCFNTDSILVKTNFVSGKNAFYVPNAFTPNHDGLNDCFGVKNWNGVKEFKIEIFNRWGRKVFVSNDASTCWDGRYNGLPQPGGVYVYLLKAKTNCGDENRKGIVTLVR